MQDKIILITDKVPEFFLTDLEKIGFEVKYDPHLSETELYDLIPVCLAILIRSRFSIDKRLLMEAKNLKLILRPGSGLDNIDTEEASKRNITTINSPEGNRDAVAEHSLGMLLSLLNNIHSSFNEISSFHWDRDGNIGKEIKGNTVGIFGYGNTGSAFAKRLSSFEADIIAFDKYKSDFSDNYVREVSKETLFKSVEILSFHIPLNSETYNIVDENFYNFVKNPFYLINTSRGGILNLGGLLKAINKGKVLGAALDVLENEDLGSYNQKEKHILKDIIDTQKVIITPHIAGRTIESEKKIFSILIDKIKKLDF